MKIDLLDGKYTAVFEEKTGKLYALRHGEEWRDLCGDGFVLALMHKIEDLQKKMDNLLGFFDPFRPKIVCLCGSTRFMEAFQEANLAETLKGNIVLSVGCNTKSDAELFKGNGYQTCQVKKDLDQLHKRKIDLADEVFILNVGGYIGESTQSEVDYAIAKNKTIRFLDHELGWSAMNRKLHEIP